MRAYLATHPACKSTNAAAVEAARLLRSPKIRARLAELRDARFRRLQMSGDEALGRVAMDARADVRKLFNPDTGKMLPVHLWPDDIAGSVRSIKGDAVTFTDPLAARRIILEHTGKLKTPAASILTLAKILAGDFDEEKDDPT